MKITTRKQAIDATCRSCVMPPVRAGTWRAQVEGCDITGCALWQFRPVTDKTQKARQAEKVANMGPEDLARHQAKAEATRQRFAK